MPSLFEFSLSGRGLDAVRFFLERDGLAANGDLESAMLDGITGLRRHPPERPLAHAAEAALLDDGVDVLAVSLNPALVMDEDLPQRIVQAVSQLADLGPWSVAAAGGLGLSDRRHLALFASASPCLPDLSGPHPLIDVMPDLFLINATFAREVRGKDAGLPTDGLEFVLTIEGYLAGRTAFYIPALSSGINGDLRSRDLTKLTDEVQRRFAYRVSDNELATLAGPIRLGDKTAGHAALPFRLSVAEAISDAISVHCAPLSISIVVRTRFDRPHLLERLLASLTRARRDQDDIEIVLSTDCEAGLAEQVASRLTAPFKNLSLRLQVNPPGTHSRVTNLLGGARAAQKDYVLFIDDDDYIDIEAFEALSPTVFAGNQPLIACGTAVHDERWEQTPAGRWVLTQSTAKQDYPASGWRKMFSGVNHMPVCGCLIPRTFLANRLSEFEFSHDLSEDYALFLLILTAPGIPPIVEIPGPVCHVSHRPAGNSVTMPDRRPWVRDIAAYLRDLMTNPATANGTLLGRISGQDDTAAVDRRSIADLRADLDKAQRELRRLNAENTRLKTLRIDSAQEAA